MAISELPIILYGRVSRALRRLRRSLWNTVQQCLYWWRNTPIGNSYSFLLGLYCYLILLTVIISVIIYAIGGIAYVDALFIATGAATQTALTTVDPENLRTSQQVMLLVTSICSNMFFVNLSAGLVRLYRFEQRFKMVLNEARNLRRGDGRGGPDGSFSHRETTMPAEDGESPEQLMKRKENTDRMVANVLASGVHDSGLANHNGITEPTANGSGAPNGIFVPARDSGEPSGAITLDVIDVSGAPKPASMNRGFRSSNLRRDGSRRQNRSSTPPSSRNKTYSRGKSWFLGIATWYRARAWFTVRNNNMPYLSAYPALNAELTEDEREELGGIEYRSLKTFCIILVSIYAAFVVIGIVGLTPWASTAQHGERLPRGVNRAWWATFTAVSALNNYGLVLGSGSLQPINQGVWPFILLSMLALVGGLGMPVMIRYIIWVILPFVRVGAFWEEALFMLDHPRIVSLTLFSSKATHTTAGLLLALISISAMLYGTLNIGNPALDNVGAAARVRAGILQAITSNSAGLYLFPIAEAAAGMQFFYLCSMWLQVPKACLTLSTLTYEERSLGSYHYAPVSNPIRETDGTINRINTDGLMSKIWKVIFLIWIDMGQHAFIVFLASIIIISIELSPGSVDIKPEMSVFGIIFEIISALCNVGFSLGSSLTSQSLSARFSTTSKVVIIIMEMVGKHRGLPRSLDRALLLPSERVVQSESENRGRLMRRRPSLTPESNISIAQT